MGAKKNTEREPLSLDQLRAEVKRLQSERTNHAGKPITRREAWNIVSKMYPEARELVKRGHLPL
jgi:hypothetical protein